MRQLDHEDYLMLFRVALGMFSQPIFIVAYILAKQYGMSPIPSVLVWSNFIASIVIFASTLAAFRVYLETRLRIRPIVEKNPDFPMRRLPDARPGVGLICPVALSLIMFVIWSSFLSVEAQTDIQRKAAIGITAALAIVGVAIAIGLGTSLGRTGEQNTASLSPDIDVTSDDNR
jgi:hypothetical protein